jgi:hypothetical protein
MLPQIQILVENYFRNWKHNVYFSFYYLWSRTGIYKSNFEIHGINTRHGTDVHPTASGLTMFWNRAIYFGTKVSNHVPHNSKNLSHEDKKLRLALKRFLLMN